jgi:hypothetical protein
LGINKELRETGLLSSDTVLDENGAEQYKEHFVFHGMRHKK